MQFFYKTSIFPQPRPTWKAKKPLVNCILGTDNTHTDAS